MIDIKEELEDIFEFSMNNKKRTPLPEYATVLNAIATQNVADAIDNQTKSLSGAMEEIRKALSILTQVAVKGAGQGNFIGGQHWASSSSGGTF